MVGQDEAKRGGRKKRKNKRNSLRRKTVLDGKGAKRRKKEVEARVG